MTTSITPQQAFQPAIFYDPNNNPLNIPCEGPKVSIVPLDFSIDSSFIIDCNQLYTQGQMTAFQALSVDMSDFMHVPSASPTEFEITFAGTNQVIRVANNTNNSYVCFAMTALRPAKISITSPSTPNSGILTLNIYNFMMPSFTVQSIFGS